METTVMTMERDQHAGISALRTCSLEELKKEPWRLQIQVDTTAEQLRALVLKNYHVFIQSNQCANLVRDDLLALKGQTDEILEAIPELKRFCAQMEKETARIVAKHVDIQFVFDHYLQLTELLEIPQLLEACIHNELFDSALDVVQFANETFSDDRNQRPLGSADDAPPTASNFVIQALIREVAQMTTLLREKLLQKLREDLQLPLCVRIVSYLRRLDVLTGNEGPAKPGLDYERQLKEEFLQCRSAWLESMARAISTSDPYQYTIQLIDVKRTSWFDMITQYSAIFGSENVDGKVDPPLCRWATTTVADFIQTLTRQLPKIDDFSSLATVLEQSLFFGGSLGRVGVDFRAILVVYFENHIVELMTQSWNAACRDFHESLQMHGLSAGTSTFLSKTPIVLASYRNALSGGSGSSAFSSKPGGNDEDYSPPRMLMSFPILAEFTNAVLSSLNDLRLCNLSSLERRLARQLQHALASIVVTIKTFAKENQLTLQQQQRRDAPEGGKVASKIATLSEAIGDMSEMLALELLPYLARCFQRLFPGPVVTTSSRSLASARMTSIDVDSLIKMMRASSLLPQLPEAPATI